MAEFSAPFDGSPIATQAQWSRMARRWGIDGVHAEDATQNGLRVTASGISTVTVAAGEAFVNGFYYSNDAPRTVNVTPNAGGAARTDMVILRCDMTAKTVTAQYKTGGTLPPTLAADESGIYEIPLAQCTVAAGSSVVAATAVSDRRWFTDRGALPSIPGARRPSIRSQLLVEGTSLYVGDGSDWRWLASAGVEDGTYSPKWTAGPTSFHWGTSATNLGRFQAVNKRVDLTIHVVPTANPPAYPEPIGVSLPPGLPCDPRMRSSFTWIFTSGNGEGSAVGVGMIFPTESTTKIARLRYPASGGTSVSSPVNSLNLLTNQPFNIREGDVLTVDGSYWLA
ncbi:hypothetical protein ACIQPQ_31120 [Streptomyces sp. NPDC091281]|uniref:hypothetical protein n=1 Tax=Streptomyces sp. NPDC091281 TaxID=3365985 RepID=UPI003804F413